MILFEINLIFFNIYILKSYFSFLLFVRTLQQRTLNSSNSTNNGSVAAVSNESLLRICHDFLWESIQSTPIQVFK